MKRFIILSLTIATVLLSSCKKDDKNDFTKPENLVGTTWEWTSSTKEDDEPYQSFLIFKSTTIVEGWSKDEIDEPKRLDWKGTFSISNNKITLSTTFVIASEEIRKTITGTIEEETIVFKDNNNTFVFRKQ